jgi:hypothetical protein
VALRRARHRPSTEGPERSFRLSHSRRAVRPRGASAGAEGDAGNRKSAGIKIPGNAVPIATRTCDKSGNPRNGRQPSRSVSRVTIGTGRDGTAAEKGRSPVTSYALEKSGGARCRSWTVAGPTQPRSL